MHYEIRKYYNEHVEDEDNRLDNRGRLLKACSHKLYSCL